MRKNGYYWCKSSERIADNGGAKEGEWVIVEFTHGEWDYFIYVQDKDWKLIDEKAITRGQR